MDRRTILRYTALFTGASVGLPLASSLLTSCAQDPQEEGVEGNLHFFSEKEFEQLGLLINTILPKSDSPSATEVGVDQIIDTMVGTVYNEEQRSAYREGFEALNRFLNGQNNLENGLQLLENGDSGIVNAVKKAYLNLKQQTIAYYLSTETIGTQFLNYLPVPGVYEPCISLEETGGKAWAI